MMRAHRERATRIAAQLGVNVNDNFVGRRTTTVAWERQANRLQDQLNAQMVEQQHRARVRAAIRDELQERVRARRPQQVAPARLEQQALQGYVQTYTISNMEDGLPILNVEFPRFVELATARIEETLRRALQQHQSISVWISGYVWMVKAHND